MKKSVDWSTYTGCQSLTNMAREELDALEELYPHGAQQSFDIWIRVCYVLGLLTKKERDDYVALFGTHKEGICVP